MAKFDYLGVIVVIILLLALILLTNIYFGMKSDGGKCIKDPFIYGAATLEKAWNESVHGSFTIENNGNMYFNSTNMIAGERSSTEWDLFNP